MDGTLLDSMSIWEEAGVRYLKSINVKPEDNLSRILFPMSLEEGAAYMKKTYRLPLSADEIISGVLGTVKNFYYYEATLKEGAKKILARLAELGIPVTIATSGQKEYVIAAFRRLQVDEYVKGIFTCSEVGEGKSSPKIYHAAARFMGTAPEETWVFEDVIHAIRTAKAAGYHVVAVYDRFSEKDLEQIKEEADVYLQTFSDPGTFWKRVREEPER